VEYARIEKTYAKPVADALVDNTEFRIWILEQTIFAKFGASARLLNNEMLALRTKGTLLWWNSHFSPKCKCPGCIGGKETDLLAIFGLPTNERFALHIEVKHPKDSFKENRQADSYPLRATCWATNSKEHPRVLPHSAATTVLLYSATRTREYEPYLQHFKSKITFEEIRRRFPMFQLGSDIVHS
jgi:hypothetical protein